jgi:hypothetical protein
VIYKHCTPDGVELSELTVHGVQQPPKLAVSKPLSQGGKMIAEQQRSKRLLRELHKKTKRLVTDRTNFSSDAFIWSIPTS